MFKGEKNTAVSEVIGALLLIVILMTGLSIISVILLSGPPPSSGMKAILGVKCSWCPNINPPQYDILIGHEGGENISLDKVRIIVFNETEPKIIHPGGNIQFFSPGEKDEYGKNMEPPETCDQISGASIPVNRVLATGQSLKFKLEGSNSSAEQPKTILIQEPSPLGYSTISQLKINYIQNVTSPNTEMGYKGLIPVSNELSGLIPYVGEKTNWSPDGCEVTFTYINYNDDDVILPPIPYGSTQQSMWNYIEPVSGWYSSWEEIEGTTREDFPSNSSGTAVKIKNFTGKIVYNLGSYSTKQVTCLEWE